MKVRINLTSKAELHFRVEETTLISELKRLVEKHGPIPTHTFQLVFGNQVLEDDKSIAYYNIHDDALLDIQGDLSSTLFPVLSTETLCENHMRNVHAGVFQVWGMMIGEGVYETPYEHTTWYRRVTYNVLGHVRAVHENQDQEIVLKINKVFTSELVQALYDFLYSLVLWWTPSEEIEEHEHVPPYNRMQQILMIYEHTLQAPFDMKTMQKQDEPAMSARLEMIERAIQECDDLHAQVLRANEQLPFENKTPGLLVRLGDLSGHLRNLRHFIATPVETRPQKRQRFGENKASKQESLHEEAHLELMRTCLRAWGACGVRLV